MRKQPQRTARQAELDDELDRKITWILEKYGPNLQAFFDDVYKEIARKNGASK